MPSYEKKENFPPEEKPFLMQIKKVFRILQSKGPISCEEIQREIQKISNLLNTTQTISEEEAEKVGILVEAIKEILQGKKKNIESSLEPVKLQLQNKIFTSTQPLALPQKQTPDESLPIPAKNNGEEMRAAIDRIFSETDRIKKLIEEDSRLIRMKYKIAVHPISESTKKAIPGKEFEKKIYLEIFIPGFGDFTLPPLEINKLIADISEPFKPTESGELEKAVIQFLKTRRISFEEITYHDSAISKMTSLTLSDIFLRTKEKNTRLLTAYSLMHDGYTSEEKEYVSFRPVTHHALFESVIEQANILLKTSKDDTSNQHTGEKIQKMQTNFEEFNKRLFKLFDEFDAIPGIELMRILGIFLKINQKGLFQNFPEIREKTINILERISGASIIDTIRATNISVDTKMPQPFKIILNHNVLKMIFKTDTPFLRIFKQLLAQIKQKDPTNEFSLSYTANLEDLLVLNTFANISLEEAKKQLEYYTEFAKNMGFYLDVEMEKQYDLFHRFTIQFIHYKLDASSDA